MRAELRPLILASRSPRRQALLLELGIPFEVRPAEVDETFHGPDFLVEVEELARKKASQVAGTLRRGTVLGADTIVEVGGEVLGKPRDAADARRMLRKLSGTRHRVHTAVALVHVTSGRRRSCVETTEVRMRPIPEDEIDAYVASGEPMDKAGAYAVQETGDRFVLEMRGEWDNVVGLPLRRVRELVVALEAELPGRRWT
jgi:septum formation protein